MDGDISGLNGPPLPLSCLRLLVPPLRLVSAAIWQTVQQKVVTDYGMLEEFVSMVTEIVPELLTRKQRAELTLGLRARLILELCRSGATVDLQIIQTHLDRMQILTASWVMEHDAVDMELSNTNFIGLVQTLLKSLQEREHFFQNVFPEEFGPTYDKALQTLMWQFLSRLEKLLPLQTLQQVASLLIDVPSVLEECLESVSHPEELKTLLEYQKDLSQLDHNDCSIDGACIISALSLSPVERRVTVNEKTQSEVHTVCDIFSVKSGTEKESARLQNIKQMEMETIVDVNNRETNLEEPHVIMMFSADGSSMPLDGEMNSNEEGFGIFQTQEENKFRLKQTDCRAPLKKLDMSMPLNSRSVRRNRGLKMKAILLQEKRKKEKTGPYEEERHTHKPKSASQAAAYELRLKQTDCRAPLKKLDVPMSLTSRPVRQNRGLKMKAILQQEKRKKEKTGPYEEERYAHKPKSASQAAAYEPCTQAQMSPSSSKCIWPSVTEDKVTCSEAAPTSGALPERSDDEDSISISSDKDPSYVAPVGSCEEASSSNSSDEDPSIVALIDDEDFSVIGKVQDASHTKATTTKKTCSITQRGSCCICKEHVKVNMTDHMKVHFPNDDYACPHCNTKFTSWSCMKSHLTKTCYDQQQVGPEEAEGAQSVFKCDECDQAFRYKLSLNEHKRTHNQLYCEVCRKVLRDSETLARHKVSHTPFQCTLCEVNFRHFKPLANHYEVVHQLRSPFNCNHCQKSFSKFRLFIRHEWRHKGQLPFQCAQCSKRFKSDSDLVVHLRIHTGEKVFLCWKCGKAMRYRVSLKRHLKICKHKQIPKPHTCSQCQLSFKLKDSLRNHERIKHKVATNASGNYRRCFICKKQVSGKIKDHMKIHFPSGIYTCPQCNSTFALLGSLKLHLKRTCFDQQQVGPEEAEGTLSLFRCDECDQVFRYELSLKEHKRTHNQLYCEVCRKTVRDSETLARHKASHTAFQCTMCEENFRHYKHLAKHYENVHKLSKPFSCNHCPKSFTKLKFFIRHEWKHTGYLPFQCSQCSMRFKDDPDLVSHLRVHTREKPFLCAECGKAFSSKSNLSRHLKVIHSQSPNEKKYSCPQCEKSFKEKRTLDKHEKRKHLNVPFRSRCPDCGKMLSSSAMGRHRLIHTGEKPFKCKMAECDKSFRSVTEMKKHMQYHTEERPFRCNVCGKGFVRSSLLNEHMRIHTGEKPHVCSLCGKAFSQLYSMKRHKKLIHTFEVE